MIGPTNRTRVFAYGASCDMRKSFNTLSGLVSAMGHDVAAGDVYLFVSKNRKRAKALWYDATGLVLLAKRLDVGKFAAIWESNTGEIELTEGEHGLAGSRSGCDQATDGSRIRGGEQRMLVGECVRLDGVGW